MIDPEVVAHCDEVRASSPPDQYGRPMVPVALWAVVTGRLSPSALSGVDSRNKRLALVADVPDEIDPLDEYRDLMGNSLASSQVRTSSRITNRPSRLAG